MTTETRTFIQFSDIIGIEACCPKCGARIGITLENFTRFGIDCPVCREHWLTGPDVVSVRDFLERFSDMKRSETATNLSRLEVAVSAHDKEA